MRTFRELSTFNDWLTEEKDLFTVNVIKGLVMDGVRKANSGHTGGPMSSADFLYILFTEFLKQDPITLIGLPGIGLFSPRDTNPCSYTRYYIFQKD